LSNTLIGGKYRPLRRLGHGAMGEVWAAINIDTDREVALKLITSPDPEFRMRLLREARAIGRLNHPNIVQILDRGETEAGEPFLVMQLLQGETLGQKLRREGALPEATAAGIALDVARALRVAHEKDIIHRDLKPANIFLHREPDTEEDVVKVVDFGVSKMSIENEGNATLTGGIVGSPAYMSPEQIRCGPIDGRADVWALGVVLYEMLVGHRPFSNPSAIAVIGQVMQQPIRRVDAVAPGVSAAIADVVSGCLERDLGRRIASAADLSARLKPFAVRRFGTLDDASARARLASLPDAPAAPEPAPPPAADEDRPRESDVETAVFKPGMMAPGPRMPPPQAPITGTVIAAGVPAAAAKEVDATETVIGPGLAAAAAQAAPSPRVDHAVPSRESATSVFMSPDPHVGRGTVPMSPRAPPPSPVSAGSGSWPRVVEPSTEPSRAAVMPPAPPRPGERSAHERTQELPPGLRRGGAFPTDPAERKRVIGQTLPIDPQQVLAASPYAPRPAPAPRSHDPVARAPDPEPAWPGAAQAFHDGAASGPKPRAPTEPFAEPPGGATSTSSTTPLARAFAPPAGPAAPEPSRAPLILLGVSAGVLLAVVASLIITLSGDRPAGPAAPPSASAPASASASASAAKGAPPPGR
jgi:eukaryotic-like serine/threonine-protein kinase